MLSFDLHKRILQLKTQKEALNSPILKRKLLSKTHQKIQYRLTYKFHSTSQQFFHLQNIYKTSDKPTKMSVTATEDQLELVNIISISETKLSNNFSYLNRRLNKHDQFFYKYLSQMESNHSSVLNRLAQVETHAVSEIDQIKLQINNIFNQLRSLNDSKIKHQDTIKKNSASCIKLNQELFNTQLQFQEKFQIQQNSLKDYNQKINEIKRQIEKVNDQVATKQNRVEVEKIIKDMEQLREKDAHFQAQIKLNQHKIQKIQIFNQKNERIQAKKDIEFMKEIQDKVKRQFKAVMKGTNGTSQISQVEPKPQKSSISMNQADKQNHLINLEQEKRSSFRKRLPFNMEEDETLLAELLKSNLGNPLSKITERISKLENQQKDINEIIKVNKFKKDDKGENSSGNVKDKINQLRPEVVKLWAKFDTLQDRLSFNEKKMDEKSKILNDLVSHQKQNNWQKMDEKMKTLQTQIYTNIKDVRAKLDTKVSLSDYEKFVVSNDDRIKQINELIYLKSDKLEVKKALLFLESKIKEIILVISEDQQNEKDALLTKKAIKCISCDKEVDKFSGNTSGLKGNWDNMPYKEHTPETLGRFGMTSFGSLAKKLKRLEGKDLPLLNNKKSNFANNTGNPSSP